MTATLQKLVKTRSQLSEAMLDYFGAVESALARNPLLDRFGRSLDEVRIPLRVVPFEPVRHREEAAQTEHFRPPLATRDDEEPDRKRYAHRSGLRDEHEPAQQPPKPLSEVEPLLQHAVLLADPGGGKTEWLKDLARRQAIRSKEELENQTVALAEVAPPVFLRLPEVAKALGRGEEDERDDALRDFLVHMGCLVPSAVLGDAQRVAAAMLMALRQRRKEQGQLPEYLVRFVWEQWFPAQPAALAAPLTRRPLVCLDAWDEVRKGRERLACCLNAFAAESACRILLTSRIVGYSHRPLPVESVAEGSQRELRICPFEWNDTEKFVTDWFRADPERGGQMIGELRTKISIWGMAGNPLMATLLCLAYSPSARRDPLPFPLRRGAVYERVLWGLLGEWPRQRGEEEQELRALGEEEKKRCVAKLDLMAELAHHFFLQGAERFSRTALEEAMRSYLSSKRSKQFHTQEAMRWLSGLTQEQKDYFALLGDDEKRGWVRDNVIAVLCKELIEQDGLLALDIEDEGESYYGFLHLSFQEYLSACALAHRANRDGWQMIEGLVDCKAWVLEWEETLILLSSRLADPLPFLKLLKNAKRDDFFRHRLCLAACCLPELTLQEQREVSSLEGIVEASDEKLQALTQQIADDVFNLWWEYQKRGCDFQHMNRSLPAIARRGPTTLLLSILECLNDQDIKVSRSAAAALKYIGQVAACPEILSVLVIALHDRSHDVRGSAAEILGRMGQAAACPEILTSLVNVALCDKVDFVRRNAAAALGQMGQSAARPEILSALVTALHNLDNWVCRSAAEALGQIGQAAARPEILTALVDIALHGQISLVRWSAKEALGQMGQAAACTEVLTALFTALHDLDGEVRRMAASSLGQLGPAAAQPEVLTALFNALHDQDGMVRSSAAYALGQLGPVTARPEVLTALLNALRDQNDQVRSSAVHALGQLGLAAAQPEVLLALLNALHDQDGWVRRNAAEALGQIEQSAARPEILTALVTALRDQNPFVRERAASALGQMGQAAACTEVLTALVDIALRDRESLARRNAASALGQMGQAAASPEVLTALFIALRNPDSWVHRNTAEQALGQIGQAAANPEVLTALVNDMYIPYSSPDRGSVADALGRMMAQGVRVFKRGKGNWEVKSVVELGQFEASQWGNPFSIKRRAWLGASKTTFRKSFSTIAESDDSDA
jgi:HEAT repeat protein